MDKIKRIISIVLIINIFTMYSSCSKTKNYTEIPDVIDVKESIAIKVLTNVGFIPVIEYVFNNTVETGCVSGTSVSAGEKAEINSKITVFISKGPVTVHSVDSGMEWWNISEGKDYWDFEDPYIYKNVLHIPCKDVCFSVPVKWYDRCSEGLINGVATVADGNLKVIPVSAVYQKQAWKQGEKQNFILKIPLDDLKLEKPTDIYLKLYLENDKTVYVNFYITW